MTLDFSPKKVPAFAVVGRTNKGKSSVVSALTENDAIAIAKEPGTTTRTRRFARQIDGQDILVVFDTPGFERATAVLEWLKQGDVPASERQNRVRDFLANFSGNPDFQFECELLKPIMDGAIIIYVVDGSHPYRKNYEAECEILQWTGQPSMAIINHIGQGDHTDEWERALHHYFKKITVFNPHTCLIDDKMRLLKDMQTINRQTEDSLDAAIRALSDERRLRTEEAALIISKMFIKALSFTMTVGSDRPLSMGAEQRRLTEEFHEALRAFETEARRNIELLFQHHKLEVQGPGGPALQKPIYEEDLFAEKIWRLLGLSKPALILSGAAAGGVAGGILDAGVGGASFAVGAGVGFLLGGVAAYKGLSSGQTLVRKFADKAAEKVIIGPYKHPNFPWILLDRAILHFASIRDRSHAVRLPLDLSADRIGACSRLDTATRFSLERMFAKIRSGKQDSDVLEPLYKKILAMLKDAECSTT